jgi:hypothetical protein
MFITAISLLFATVSNGVQVSGVSIPETVTIKGFDQPLVLNGAGVRKKFFISVYVGALYLPARQLGVGNLLSDPPPNRVSMHFVYSEVTKRKLDQGWIEGFEKNLPAQQLAALRPRLQRFVDLFDDMYEGDTVWLDYVPGSATVVTINGRVRGRIEGADFNAALLAVWLGREPVSESLKKAMVGVDKP